MCCKIQTKRFAANIDAIKTKCYCQEGSELYRKNPHATFLSRSQDMYNHSPLLDESWDGMVDLGYRPTGHQGRHAVGDIGLGCQPD